MKVYQIAVTGTEWLCGSSTRTIRSNQVYTDRAFAESKLQTAIDCAIKQCLILPYEPGNSIKPTATIIDLELVETVSFDRALVNHP